MKRGIAAAVLAAALGCSVEPPPAETIEESLSRAQTLEAQGDLDGALALLEDAAEGARERVQAVVGPLAAFEALAMDDYIRTAQIPTLPVAGAEDMTQRKANPWFVRATSTSAQCAHPARGALPRSPRCSPCRRAPGCRTRKPRRRRRSKTPWRRG